MTKLVFNTRNFPFPDRDEFLIPFDKVFDKMLETNFPEVIDQVGVTPYSNSAYPKVNVYEYDDKVGIVAEIPGLSKKQIKVDVEDNVLTISGDKHSVWDDAKAKVLSRELKQSSFKRSFTLGELLNGDDISANFKDGVLSIEIPKSVPEKPKKHSVNIGWNKSSSI